MTWQKLTVLHVLGGRATEKKQSVGGRGGDSVGSLSGSGSQENDHIQLEYCKFTVLQIIYYKTDASEYIILYMHACWKYLLSMTDILNASAFYVLELEITFYLGKPMAISTLNDD